MVLFNWGEISTEELLGGIDGLLMAYMVTQHSPLSTFAIKLRIHRLKGESWPVLWLFIFMIMIHAFLTAQASLSVT